MPKLTTDSSSLVRGEILTEADLGSDSQPPCPGETHWDDPPCPASSGTHRREGGRIHPRASSGGTHRENLMRRTHRISLMTIAMFDARHTQTGVDVLQQENKMRGKYQKCCIDKVK